MKASTTFAQLHQQQAPFILGNVWDVSSALAMQELGFKTIGTSSAAIAHTLGYEDGEKMQFEELLFMVKRIAARTTLPLSVDLEGGFSRDTSIIIQHIEQLAELGVAGINLEDSVVTGGRRELLPIEAFAKTISAIRNHLTQNHIPLFLNIRTDTYLTGQPDALAETLTRAKAYTEAGADGIFVPCITDLIDVKAVTAATSLPVNVMCMPELPSFPELAEAGVKRISMGNFVHSFLKKGLSEVLESIEANQSFKPLF